MGSPGSSPDSTQGDILDIVTQVEQPSTPVTAAEVAEKLECSRDAASHGLDELVERGELRNKQIDGATQVWWRPGRENPVDLQPDQETYPAFVGAVEDYAIFVLDPDGTVVSWNEGAKRIKGYEEDEIVGEHFSTFYTDGDIDEGVPERNLEVAAADGRVEDEGWRVRKDGSRFWANVTIAAIRRDDGTLRGFTKVTRDMTEQRKYEQRLRRERDLIEQVFETAPVGIGVLDSDGQFVRANSRLLERHGIDESDLAEYGLSSLDVYRADGDPIPEDEWPLARVAETGEQVTDFRCQVETPTGDRRWLSINAAPLEVESQEDARIVATVEDITDQKTRERQLQRERDQTEQLVRTAPIAIAVQNADRETVMANQRAQDAFGLSEREFLGNPVDTGEWEIYDSNGDPIDPAETTSARVLETGEPVYDEEFVFVLPNDERRYFRVNTAPLFGPDGEIDRVITAGEEITELKRRERQLERRKTELETELNEIFNRISDAFCALDDEYRFTHLNDHAAELMRQPKAEILGREIWDVVADGTEDLYREKLQTAMEAQESISFEVYEEDSDAWFEFTVYPSESGLSIYFRDVTERVAYERELAKYETIVETINDGIYVKDEDGHFTMVNEAYAELTGYDRENLVGEHASLVVDETTIDRSQEIIATASAEQAGFPAMEAEIRTADGDRVPVEGTLATLQADTDREEIGVVRDITERKERERALRERERRLKRYKEYTDDVLNAVDDIFYLLDETGELQRWNESISDVTGYSDAEISSMRALDFFDETGKEKISAAIADGFETGSVQVEADVRTKDGMRIPYEFVASTLEDPDGNLVLAGVGRDIASRQEYERKLEASNERLEQFAYAASHDLQEPLRMVTSYLQLLENRYADELDEDAREFIEFAVDGAGRMRDMIDGLLEYSRIETQGDAFESIDLETVLSDVYDDLQLQIEESDAEITAESLPRVEGDPSQLRQVFQNLLGNAIEYSGDEPPRVHIAAERTGPDWRLSIRDEGIGIDPEDADRIFEVFQRLHNHEEHAGTGIGLALCRRIIERHGGEIWIESEPGEGATVSFTLPAADEGVTDHE